MANVLLLNPRSRKGKKKKSRKKNKPSAAQLRARRAFARRARAQGRARRRRRYAPLNRTAARRKSSKTLRRSIRSPFAGVTMARRRTKLKRNPSRRRRRRSHRRLRRNPVRRLRRNPIIPSGFMRSYITPAAIGAIGGLINDVAVGTLVSKLPAKLQAPEFRDLVKALIALGLGIGAQKLKIASSSTVHTATIGALTIVGHDAARRQLQKMLPGVQMGEYLLGEQLGPWSPPAIPGRARGMLGERVSDGRGAYDYATDDFEECTDEVIS